MQNQQNGDLILPAELTAEMLAGFRTTPRGCTHPRVGEIGGHRFIAKCGSWSAYSSDEHVHNEFVADNLLRAAGLNVLASIVLILRTDAGVKRSALQSMTMR